MNKTKNKPVDYQWKKPAYAALIYEWQHLQASDCF